MDTIKLFIEKTFKNEIKSYKKTDYIDGEYEDLPETLDNKLLNILNEQGINKLYSHQKEAFDKISNNQNTLLVSSTASGKTLSFFLPILNEYTKSVKPFSVLLLYPTKALSRDQEGTFAKLMNGIEKTARLGTYDGDTPREERDKIQKEADFIITNPDMLHNGILPNHNRRWKVFLSRLRYIVIDEVHIYRGAFGSHVSNVMRRLLRVCSLNKSNPTFVCSSATIGNPLELTMKLFHNNFHLIDKDGAPKSSKELYYINPPMIEKDGRFIYRKGTNSVSIPLIREASKQGIRTICFCRGRQEVERLYRAVIDNHSNLKDIIKPYRGGLLPSERRQLEKDLFSGRIKTIISTNALELGIDIGDLDLCILSGHPGTIASFWQQAGRVGRKGNNSIIVYVAKNSPIDQYLVHHPDFFEKKPVEQAWINPDNPYILLQHLPCSASEYPLKDNEELYKKEIYNEALEILKEQKIVLPYHESYRYALQNYPSKGVNLRGMTDYNIEIYCGTEIIGEIDPIGARDSLYKDAIYQHLGTKYMSMDLDLEKKLCRVEEVNVDYYTESVWEGRVELTESEEIKTINESVLSFGNIYINRQPKLYKKIRERSYENVGYGPITLEPFEYETTGFSILISPNWIEFIEETDKRYIGAGLYGLGYLLRHVSPGVCMADINDISTDISLVPTEKNMWKNTLFLYDSLEGGVGYAEKIFEIFDECLSLCKTILIECECQSGCPSCVPPLPPGVDNSDLELFLIESNASKECTRSLLESLTTGKLIIPDVIEQKIMIEPNFTPPKIDKNREELIKKLNKASKILSKKRERIH